MRRISLTLEAIHEAQPGPKWQRCFAERWEGYRRWFLHEGEAARPSYAMSVRMLREYMPELLPTYRRLLDLAGGGDLPGRMLSMWGPPSYLSGCSQAVWTRGRPVLVRNYDYAPQRFEGVVMSTAWTGRRVIGTSDSLWGLLDGVNDAGLAVSLAFGGRPVVGRGFGVPLVVRYLLETCGTVGEARRVLGRLPYHLAHTLTLTDRGGGVLTAYLSPDRGAEFAPAPAATNHQGRVEWAEHAAATRSVERERCLLKVLEDPALTDAGFAAAFLRPPLHSSDYSRGFGTLYTAVYRPDTGAVEYRWPGAVWRHSFADFREGTHVGELVEPPAA